MQVKKQVRTGYGTTDRFQVGWRVVKAAYCHAAYSTSMQSISWEMLDCMKHKLETRLPGEMLNVEFEAKFFTPFFYFPQEAL